MSLQEERMQVEGLETNFRNWFVELVHSEVFKCGAQNPKIPQSTSRGFPNNKATSAKERRLKLPEGSVHLLYVLHTRVLSKISFER